MLQGPQSFCLSVYDYDNEILQSLVDHVNMALRTYPNVWSFVADSGLLKYQSLHPLNQKIFDGRSYELEAILAVTELTRKRAGLSS